MKRSFLAILSLLVTSACSEALFFAANFPSFFSAQKITRDIDFGSKNGMKLDVYTPDDKNEKRPVLVFFYGGAWMMGSKESYRFAADAFTKHGYVVVIPDYIKYPEVKFPAWQEDAAKAVAWAHNNIAKFGGDESRLFIAGHSAGAHIGALLATDEEYLKKEGGSRSWIKAFAGLAGPYDFVPEEPEYKDMFGPPERYKYMQVTNYIDGKQPPMLLLWGLDDKEVAKENITKLETGLKDKSGVWKTKYYEGVNHIDIVGGLAYFGTGRAPVAEDVDDFFIKYGK